MRVQFSNFCTAIQFSAKGVNYTFFAIRFFFETSCQLRDCKLNICLLVSFRMMFEVFDMNFNAFWIFFFTIFFSLFWPLRCPLDVHTMLFRNVWNANAKKETLLWCIGCKRDPGGRSHFQMKLNDKSAEVSKKTDIYRLNLERSYHRSNVFFFVHTKFKWEKSERPCL